MKIFAVLVSVFAIVACTQQSNNQINSAGNQAGIINGENVQATDPIAKHLVAITDNRWENCTGTLIAKNLVLTAAHCETTGVTMYVAFGLEVSERNINTVTRFAVVDYRVLPGRYQVSPDVDDKDQKDLMILKFEGELPAGYEPVEFLTDETLLKKGVSVLVAGYGVTNGKTQVGNGFLKKTQIPIWDAGFSDTEVQTDERRRGTCNIDSGGPAFVKSGDKFLYWGVTSRGAENCNGDGIYTKVTYYNDWIQDTIVELGGN